MSTLENDRYWEAMLDNYWDKYLEECKLSNTSPDYSDFMVWCEDNDLVQEP